jgi:50S ribosomal subunit-associated GTPase HflX
LDVNPQAVLMLAGNKIDLIEETAVSLEALAALAKYYHASYLLTSAKTGQSVEHLFLMLAEKILGVR